ncbi:unnamed protein product [Nezara viridula]|uniref:Uncharacterized protein n=1 Tax=Nezara viridula TaxID=85310 RepID=A0A9P0HSS0_NEZVI|nr:unnamed protein product [Nezara viridula]
MVRSGQGWLGIVRDIGILRKDQRYSEMVKDGQRWSGVVRGG